MKQFKTYLNEWKLTSDSDVEVKNIKPDISHIYIKIIDNIKIGYEDDAEKTIINTINEFDSESLEYINEIECKIDKYNRYYGVYITINTSEYWIEYKETSSSYDFSSSNIKDITRCGEILWLASKHELYTRSVKLILEQVYKQEMEKSKEWRKTYK